MNKEAKPQTLLEKLNLFARKRTSYLLGVLLGVVLIIINVYVGLTIVTLLLDSNNQLPSQAGISLPVIKTKEYEDAKFEYLKRQQKQYRLSPSVDPFKIN